VRNLGVSAAGKAEEWASIQSEFDRPDDATYRANKPTKKYGPARRQGHFFTTRQPRKTYGTCTVIGEEYELSSPLEFTEVAA
jgi:hypothetical protein